MTHHPMHHRLSTRIAHLIAGPSDQLDDRFDDQLDDQHEQVEVRRNGPLAAVLCAVAGLVALAYLVRAVGGGSVVDWLVVLAVGAIAVVHGLAALDSRVPLLVADRTGLRLRLGRTWSGLTWDQLEEVEHAPRRSVLRDGRLVAFPLDPAAALDDLGPWARRQAALAERVHGAPFAVPLGITTRTTSTVPGAAGLTAALLELAPDPELVVEVVPDADWADEPWATSPSPVLAGSDDTDHVDHGRDLADAGATRDAGDPADLVDTVERPRPALALPMGPAMPGEWDPDQLDEPDRRAPVTPAARAVQPSRAPSPLRASVAAVRAEVTSRVAAHRAASGSAEPTVAMAARTPSYDDLSPELAHLRPGAPVGAVGPTGPTDPDDTGVWRTTTQFMPQLAGPARTPVVGPQLARARQALGLDVERLAERTRIRPHVIEAIEVDDFESCGGDFYARGHLRTLARVLGIDAQPLLLTYDESYADAPIDPRRVFEAELATSSEGAIRSLRGGSNWSVVVAAVMAVVLAWSVARLVVDRPDDSQPAQPGLSAGSAGLTSGRTDLAPAVPVVVTAEGGGAKVVVRDGAGSVVFKGNLAFGQSKTLEAAPPVRVQTSDGSLTVSVAGEPAKQMGRTGKAARNTFVPETS